MFGKLIAAVDELREEVAPILDGQVERVAIDTETSEVLDGRFTPLGTDTRIAGFSLSWGREADLYVPVRHVPYDWRRPIQLMVQDKDHDGHLWVDRLLEVERVLPEDEGPGWQDGADPNVDPSLAFELLQLLLKVKGVEWLAHNWPFDSKMFLAEGLELPWDDMEDTQALSTFTDERPLDKWDDKLNEGRGGYVHGGHSLKHLGEAHLGRKPDEQALLEQAKAALGAGGARLNNYAMLPLRSAVAPYGCMDTRLVLELADACRARPAYQLEAVRALLEKHKVERRISVGMEWRGVHVDRDEAEARAKAKESEAASIAFRASQLAGGRAVPFDSGPALSTLLYQTLGLPQYRQKEDTRKPTLKKVVGRLLAGQAPTGDVSRDDAAELVQCVLDYRAVTKELRAFYRPLTQFGEDGRVYPILNPIRARTTRYSAESPNVQQAKKPKKDNDPEVAQRNQVESVRYLFKPEPGHVWIPLDYSQQEMRVAAHYATALPRAFAYRFTWRCTLERRGDCKGKKAEGHGPDVVHSGYRENVSRAPGSMYLVDGFMSGERDFDPHAKMVEWCQQLGLTFIDRDTGKTAGFAALYGAGRVKLADTLDCEVREAGQVLDTFWDKAYPELGRVRVFIDERLRKVGKASKYSHQNSISTLHGAPIHLDGGYKGLNYVVQRSCREILLNAEVAVDEYMRRHCPTYYMVLPVHDELILGCPEGDLDQEHVRNIARLMVWAGRRSRVPMVVEPNLCRENWAEKADLPLDWGWNGVTDGVPTDEEVEALCG